MSNEQVTIEIKARLNKVYNLLKEIEDILCKDKNDGQLSENNCSCICVCGKQSIPEIIEMQSNHKDDDSKKYEKMQKLHVICSKKRAKYKGLGREKMSPDVNDISLCRCKSYKQNHEKNNSKILNDLCCNISNKQINNNTQYDCMHKLFRNKINDIEQKYMSYFDEINKNESNTTIGSTAKSKKTSRF